MSYSSGLSREIQSHPKSVPRTKIGSKLRSAGPILAAKYGPPQKFSVPPIGSKLRSALLHLLFIYELITYVMALLQVNNLCYGFATSSTTLNFT